MALFLSLFLVGLHMVLETITILNTLFALFTHINWTQEGVTKGTSNGRVQFLASPLDGEPKTQGSVLEIRSSKDKMAMVCPDVLVSNYTDVGASSYKLDSCVSILVWASQG